MPAEAAGFVIDAPSPWDALVRNAFRGVGIERPRRGAQESRPGTARRSAKSRKFAAA